MPDPSDHAEALQTAAATVATDIAHDAERDTRHALSHLEPWFLTECASLAAYLGANIAEMENEAKLLLARLAAKL